MFSKDSRRNCFICHVCPYSAREKSRIIRHLRMHSGEKPFVCYQCKEGFSQKGNLIQHMAVHMGEAHYFCTVCSAPFRTSARMIQHSKIHVVWRGCPQTLWRGFTLQGQGIPTRQYSSVVGPANLDFHRDEATGLYVCGECPYSTLYKGNMRSHHRTHTGEKPFKCGLCGRGFTHNHNLKAHIYLHTGEKPFQCTTCKRQFTKKFGLVAHIKMGCRKLCWLLVSCHCMRT